MFMKLLRYVVFCALNILLWAGATHAGTIPIANFSVSGHDRAYSMAVDTDTARDNRVYVVGQTWNGSDSTMDMLILKYDFSGILIASTTYRFANGYDDCARSCAVDRSGNLLVTGYSRLGSVTRCVTLKYGYTAGAAFPAPAPQIIIDASGNSLAIMPNNEVLVAGMHYPATGYVAKYNSAFTAMVTSGTFGSAGSTTTLEGITTNGLWAYVTGTEDSGSNKYMRLWRFDASQSFFTPMAAPFQNDMTAGYAVALDTAGYVYVTGESAGHQCVFKKFDMAISVMHSSFSISGFSSESSGRSLFIAPSNKPYAAGISAMPWPAQTFGLELNAALSTCTYRFVASSPTVSAVPLTPCTTDFFFCAATSSDTIKLYKTYYPAPPGRINDLSYDFIGHDDFTTSIRLSWPTPAEDGFTGTLAAGASYVIQHSTAADGQWSYWTQISTFGVTPGTIVSEMCGTGRNNPHYFRIYTVDAAQMTSPVSNVVEINDVNMPPAAVTDLSATVQDQYESSGTVRLSWTMPGKDGYSGALSSACAAIVWYKQGPSGTLYSRVFWLTKTVTPGTTYSLLVDGFTTNATYYYSITLRDEANYQSGQSNEVNVIYYNPPQDLVAPAAVTGLRVALKWHHARLGYAQLEWTLPGDNGNTGTFKTGSHYTIEISSYGAGNWMPWCGNSIGGFAAGVATSTVIGSLMENATTYVRLIVHDGYDYETGSHQSDPSNVAEISIVNLPPAPITDLAVRLSGRSSAYTRFVLSWTQPGQDGNDGLLAGYYTVENSSMSATGPWASMTVYVSSGMPGIPVEQNWLLPQKTDYYFRVLTNDDENASGPSNIVSASDDNPAPGAITDLAAAMETRDFTACRVRLRWTMPGDDGSIGSMGTESAIILAHRAGANGTWDSQAIWLSTITVPGQQYSYLINGVTYNTTHYYTVTMRDGASQSGGISNQIAIIEYDPPLDLAAPGPITDLAVVKLNRHADKTSVQLSWSMPGTDGYSGALTGFYRIEYATSTTGTTWYYLPNIFVSSCAPATPMVRTLDVTQNVTWYFRVLTNDGPHMSAPSNLPEFYDVNVPPAAITDLTGLVRHNDDYSRVTLSWTMPGDDGSSGSLLYGSMYRISWKAGEGNWTDLSAMPLYAATVPGSRGSCDFPSLQHLTTYYFRISVRDDGGNWSDPSNTLTIYDYNAPKINDLSAEYVNGGLFVLRWTSPGSDAAPAGSRYLIYSSTISAAGPWQSFQSYAAEFNGPVASSFTVAGTFELGKMYHFMVRYKDGMTGNTSDSNPAWGEVKRLAGAPFRVGFEQEIMPLAVRQGVLAGPVKIKLYDAYNSVTVSTVPVTVFLSGKAGYMSGNDANARFQTVASGNTLVSSVTIAAGQNSGQFYFTTTSTSTYAMIQASSTVNGFINDSLSVSVLQASGITWSQNSVNNDGSAQINFTFDQGVINSANMPWRVVISSSADLSYPNWSSEYTWGYAAAAGTRWDGSLKYFDTAGRAYIAKAPRGQYYVRLRFGRCEGGWSASLGQIDLNTYEITGRVKDAGNAGVSGVMVMAYGQSYSQSTTAEDGTFRISGLSSGKYTVRFDKTGFNGKVINNVTPSSDPLPDVVLNRQSFVRINAHRTMNPEGAYNPELTGSVKIYGDDNGRYYCGNIHFGVDISTSDNGIGSTGTSAYLVENSTDTFYNSGRWTVLALDSGTYHIDSTLDGYRAVTSTISVHDGETVTVNDILFPFRKNVNGYVELAAPAEETVYPSIEVIPSGARYATAWSWTSIAPGLSSGAFTVMGLDDGGYTIKSHAAGYRDAEVTVNTASTGTAHIAMDQSGTLTGTITVIGDAEDPSLGIMDPFDLYVNAWSPDTQAYGSAKVSVTRSSQTATSSYTLKGMKDGSYWVNCWLNGFELDEKSGYNGVRGTVAAGSGTLNLVLRRYSGKAHVRLTIPEGASWSDVKVMLSGGSFYSYEWYNGITPSSASGFGGSFNPESGVLTTPGLGTGAYQIRAVYLPTGLEKNLYVMLKSGETKEVNLALSGESYAISGTVSMTGTIQGMSTIAEVAAKANADPLNSTWLPGPVSTTTFRVFAVDYTALTGKSQNISVSNSMKSGVINDDGSFSITGLPKGVYMLAIPSLELNMNAMDGRETAQAESVAVVNSTDVVRNFTLSAGYSISGRISLPSGSMAGAARAIFVVVRSADETRRTVFNTGGYFTSEVVRMQVNFTAASEIIDYSAGGLMAGDYLVSVEENSSAREFANAAKAVHVEASNVSDCDFQLYRGGRIVFKLRDAESGMLLTPKNWRTLLPWSFGISALANPWVEGGWYSLDQGVSERETFELSYLPEATYDLLIGQSSYGRKDAAAAAGANGTAAPQDNNSTSYAYKTVKSISIKEGQTVNMGTIEIKQGKVLAGTVKDRSGNPLPNIPVVAAPSLTNEWSSQLYGITDINGKFSIAGLDPDIPYYDLIACPRVDLRDFGSYFFFGSGGITYGEKTRTMIKVAGAPSIDFVLDEAKGIFTGRVTTWNNGSLKNPDDNNLPAAKVYLQMENTVPRTNPLGDICTVTDIEGMFTVEALSPGRYRLTVMSAGYASLTRMVDIGESPGEAIVFELQNGARIAGTITTVEGKNPSTAEVRSLIAANDDLTDMITATLKTSGEKTVTGYELNGLKANVSYNLMFLTGNDDYIPAVTGYSVPFSSYTRADYGLTYRVVAPAVFCRMKREGVSYQVYFDISAALRNEMPSDNDLNRIVTVASGAGTLSNLYIAPNRKTISCTYTAAQNEDRFSLLVKACACAVDPETGSAFLIDERFDYLAGIGARHTTQISNLKGGKVTLEGDSSSVLFAPGTFETGSSTSTVNIDFARAERLDDIVNRAPAKGAPRMVVPRSSSAYPEELYRAMTFAREAGVDPFSSFYDVMLPAGIARMLNNDATLSLQYADGADPAQLNMNIYYYDPVNNVYLLESRNRTVDIIARTISVSVNHASVFVILSTNTAVVQGTAYNGPLFVYNYPNPFDLSAKTLLLNNAPLAYQTQTIKGTMIHYGLPQDVSGDVEIRIYNVAGELVRSIRDGARAGGSHYYTEWDGTNDSGATVASGVYIARFRAGGKDKYFKMAVIR